MGNLLKKVTSTVSVLAIAASAMGATASVSAASEFLAYADMLAKSGVINSTTEANYRLGDTITRAEVAKIAVKLSGVEMYDCVGDVFSDVGTSLGDLCSAIETAAAEGFVNANADKFRPTDKVTRAELVKMLLAANGVEPSDTAANFKDTATIGDLAGYINAGVEIGAIKDGEYFRPNANATRGEAFKIASVVMDSVEPTTPPTNGTGTTTPPTTSTGTTSTGVVTAGGLSIATASSAMQYVPMAGTIKAGKISFASSSSDVTVKSLLMKRGGLGDRNDIDTVWLEYNGKRVTTQASVNSDDTLNVSFTPSWKLMAGTSASLDLVVKLKSKTAGGQHNFAIVAAKDVSSTASTLTATFPVVTNTLITTNYTTSAVSFGSVAVNSPTLKVGEKSALLGEFRVDVTGDRDVVVTSASLYNSGTLDASKYLSNIALYSKSTGAKVSSSVVFDGRTTTFVVNDTIASSVGNRVYQLKADIIGTDRPSESLQFSFDGRNDNITVEEISTAYRAATTLTSSSLYNVKVEAGSLAFTTDGSTASVDVAASTSDVRLLTGKVTAKEQVKLRDFTISFASAYTGSVDYSSGVFTNAVSRVRVNLGGQSVTIDAASFSSTGSYTISNTFIVDAGVSPLTISADIRAGATAGTVLMLNSVKADSFGDARYTSSDQQVSDRYGSVSPVSRLTIKGAGVSLSNQSAANLSAVKGAKNVSLLKYQIVNNEVSDVTVNGETFDVTYVDGGSGAADINSLKNMTVDMYINGDLVESKNISVNGASATLTFNKTFSVAKSSNSTIELKTQELPQLDNNDTVRVTRPTSSNMSDLNGKTVTIGSVTTGNLVSIANASLTVAVDANDSADLLAAGTANQELGKIRVTAKNDDLSIRELKVNISSLNMTGATRLIQSPTLVDAAGNVIANGTINTTDKTIEFVTFNNGGFKVARNTDSALTVKASISTMSASEVNTQVALNLAGANFYLKAQGSVDEVILNNLSGVTGTTAVDLISGGKLVVAANGVQDAGQGYVKYTITNGGSEAVKLTGLGVNLGSSTGAVAYKDSVSPANQISTGTVSSGILSLSGGTVIAEVAAGQSLVVIIDLSGEVSALSSNATITFSVTDLAYMEKVEGVYVGNVSGINTYKSSTLPASTSYSRGSGIY